MKATTQQQLDLLALAEIDAEIARSRRAVADSSNPEHTASLRETVLELASLLIDARSSLESLELEAKRAQEDLDVVEQRIAKDHERLNSTSSSKDAQGVQHELETLSRRKGELEDAQLALLDLIDQARAKSEKIAADKAFADQNLAQKHDELEAELVKHRSGLDLLQNRRAQQAANLSAELADLYEKKAKRSTPVARLMGRECGACRMTIGATVLADFANLASDEIASCPECQAVLVR